MDKLESRTRFRFSLRALFLLATVVAVLCYWLMLPTIVAKRFLRAIDSADYATADNCFHDAKDRIFNGYNQKFWTFQLKGSLAPSSAGEFWRCERQITFELVYGGPMPLRFNDGTIIATRQGLKSPEITGASAGGFGM